MTDNPVTNNDTDPVLTIRDIARRTNLSEGFIYMQVVNGAIEHYTFGGSTRKRGAIRFSEQQFRQFLNNQEDRRLLAVGVPVSNITQVAAFTQTSNRVTSRLNRLMQQGR